jgi:hypothetical protein
MANSDSFYNELKEDVLQIAKDYGAEFNVQGAGVTDLSTQTMQEGSIRKVWGIITDSKVQELTGMNSVIWEARKTLIMPYTAEPKNGEQVIVDGIKYPLNKVTTIKPAEVIVVYLLDVSE